jgi:hypothetical protein
LSTQEMLRKILSTHCVHPGFLDFLSCFGAKRDEKDEDMFGGYVSRFWSNSSDSPGYGLSLLFKNGRNSAYMSAEFFYNLRYVEESARATYPWSVRRMGVYQKYNSLTNSSVWIVIRPTPVALTLTNNFFLSQQLPLAMHLWLMSSTIGKWRSYLKHWDNEIREKVSSNS